MRPTRRLLQIVLLLAGYTLAGRLGLSLAFTHDSASPVWPPSGIALAALLILGRSLWPVVFLGALLVNLPVHWDLAGATTIAVGNTLEAVLGAWLTARLAGGTAAVASARSVFCFAAIAAASATVAATIGVTTLALRGFGAWQDFDGAWLTWWLGDLCGVLLVTPPVLLWAALPVVRRLRPPVLEQAALLVVLAMVGTFLFGFGPMADRHYPLSFLAIPVVLWVAFRFGARDTAMATLLLAAVVLTCTLHGRGPYVLSSTNESLLVVQTYLGVLSLTGLSVAATVAERSRVHRSLADSEGRFRAMVEQTTVAVAELDTAGRMVMVNNRFAELAGRDPAELTGRRLVDLLHGEDQPGLIQSVAGLAKGHMGTAVAGRVVRPDGGWAWFDGSLSLLAGPGGEPKFVVAILQDVTERRMQAMQQRALEQRLQQAQRLESLGVLAGGIAHDFNNLLTAILGNAQLALQDLPPNHASSRRIEALQSIAGRASVLTRQMQAYAGRASFEVLVVDLTAQVREILAVLSASLPKNVQLRTELRDGLPAVAADVAQLQQLVWNLVINAAEAVGAERQGSVWITTGAELLAEPEATDYLPPGLAGGMYVYLEVADDGCGMDETTRSRVFEPFFTTKFTGRGLGLSAAIGIVRGHRGGLRVTSSPGRGSTFRACFPATTADRPRDVPPPEAVRGPGHTVLVVDDEARIREVARLGLERFGYRVLLAEGGRAALAILAQEGSAVDLVLLDMTMPGMSGLDTLVEIRRSFRDLPVLLSSGFDESEAQARFQGQGLAGFLQKPYTGTTLAARVEHTLRQGPVGR